MSIDFKNLFQEKILKRGYNYYLDDSVHDVTKNGEIYEGLVYGTEIYEVKAKVDIKGNVEKMYCDCPYACDNNCKHMAALLYYIENDGYIENKKELRNVDNYDKIVENITEGEIKEFVLEKLYNDRNFQNEFRSHFVQYFEKTPKKVYERRISQSIYQAIGREGYVEYDETDKFSDLMNDYLQEARNLIKHKEYQAPFWIASLILEELTNLPIDDSDGTTSYVESECIEVIEEILEKCKNKIIISEIFNWIKNSLENDTLGDYTDGIEQILDEYFTEDDFINERLKIIDEKLNKLKIKKDFYSTYKIENLIKNKIVLLKQICNEEDIQKTIKENLYYVPIRKMLIEDEKEKGNMNKVEQLLKDGINIAMKEKHYGTVMYFLEQLLELYEKKKQNEKYEKLLRDVLFKYDRASFKYYKKLKDFYSKEKWQQEKDKIIKEFEKDGEGYHRDDLWQIYIEEEYYDKLYKSVMTTPLFDIIIRYEKYLKKDYEEKLLREYEKIVDESAKHTGKNNYQNVKKILEHMKTLKNGEKLVDNKVKEYRIKYANRRLMIEELEKITLSIPCQK